MEVLPTLKLHPKINLVFTLLYKAFKLCLNFELSHDEINKLKIVFENNGYPKSFADWYIKKYLDKIFIKKVILNVSKWELIFVLPFRETLKKITQSSLNAKLFFQSPCKPNSFFRYKHSHKTRICSDIVYRYTSSKCKVIYYGKKSGHFFTRAVEHMGISNLTGKRLKSVKQLAVSDHVLECTC